MSPTTRAKAHSAAGDDVAAGSKHDLADKKEAKNGGQTTKKQKTLEQTVENGKTHDSKTHDSKDEHDVKADQGHEKGDHHKKAKEGRRRSKSEPKAEEQDGAPDTTSDTKAGAKGHTKPSSSILEKGIIYFFLRGRVNTEDLSSADDIARTYFLLRPSSSSPSPAAAKPTDRARLIAVPKKSFPKTGRERWISFVEKTGASFAELRDTFLSGGDYETKTRGTQHTPAAKPEAEGVYAITTTGRESHLAYILTRPRELGEVQTKLGLRDRGSFIISTRNPEYPPPGGASLPESPEFPEEIKEEFRSLRWAPTKPAHLDVEGAQVLLVGESSGIDKATAAPEDREPGEETPREELEELAEEDERRMAALSGDDSEAIFADLHARAEEYAEMQSTF